MVFFVNRNIDHKAKLRRILKFETKLNGFLIWAENRMSFLAYQIWSFVCLYIPGEYPLLLGCAGTTHSPSQEQWGSRPGNCVVLGAPVDGRLYSYSLEPLRRRSSSRRFSYFVMLASFASPRFLSLQGTTLHKSLTFRTISKELSSIIGLFLS